MSLCKDAKDGWLYWRDEEQEARYLLGRPGKNNLVFVGINPNKANPDKLDPTAKRINNSVSGTGFGYIKGKPKFDGWIMINLSPQISRYPKKLFKDDNVKSIIIEENIKAIEFLKEYNVGIIYAAWGNAIGNKHRKYLIKSLKSIVDIMGSDNWYHKGELTKKHHPRHPLYVSKEAKMKPFDMVDYINTILA